MWNPWKLGQPSSCGFPGHPLHWQSENRAGAIYNDIHEHYTCIHDHEYNYPALQQKAVPATLSLHLKRDRVHKWQDGQYSVTVFDSPGFNHGFQPVLLCEVSNQEYT